MKLHGTIDKQELVKYLAKEYALNKKSWRICLRLDHTEAASRELVCAQEVACLIHDVINGKI